LPSEPVTGSQSATQARVLPTSAVPNQRTVLFEYMSRPTTPQMRVVRPASGTVVIEQRPPTDARELERMLSSRPVPTWNDQEGHPTLRPLSAPPEMSEPTPNEGSEMAGTLTRVDGPTAGCVVTLPTDQLTIGRSKRADLHLTDEGVSRKHARICWVDGAYVLEDLGSQNGSVVCGKKVSAVELKQGDLIRIGPVATLRFCWMDAHQKGLLDELYETSVRDPLTGAYNRRHFSEQLEAELAYAKRHKSELSLLLLDIDHFKRINDEHGHQEGDRVLEELTRVAHRHLRTEDVFSRYGGEEFALILRGVPLIGAARAAERLRLAIAAQVSAGTQPVSVSIGCAALGALEEGTAAALIQVADQRLYEAKQTGRGRVVASGASTPR
jgi:diguanylate cyclase (GGDEF)-like protein